MNKYILHIPHCGEEEYYESHEIYMALEAFSKEDILFDINFLIRDREQQNDILEIAEDYEIEKLDKKSSSFKLDIQEIFKKFEKLQSRYIEYQGYIEKMAAFINVLNIKHIYTLEEFWQKIRK